VITLDPNQETHYPIGDTVVILPADGLDDVDGIVNVDITHSVDNQTPGNYTVTYTATDEAGNITTEYITIVIYDPEAELILSSYYASAQSLTGEPLLLELRSIINTGLIRVSYGDSRYILDETDRDPNNQNNLINIYLGTSVPGIWDKGISWNREHVWPQSLLGTSVTNTTKNVGTDLHNLKPANPSENSSRSNRFFDEVAVGGVSYTPRLAVRGDVARILFYMVVMYDYLSLVDSTPTLYQMAMLDVLIQWHNDDPVDDFERNRNEVIYTYQKNRNPFIDYPEFVGLIDFTINMN
jgi:endonuclease I